MARLPWPWTLMVVLAAFLVAATVATATLILLVRGLARLCRSGRASAASHAARPSSNGVGAGQEPSRPLDGTKQGAASPARQPTSWWPQP
jgi:hypothetical protein